MRECRQGLTPACSHRNIEKAVLRKSMVRHAWYWIKLDPGDARYFDVENSFPEHTGNTDHANQATVMLTFTSPTDLPTEPLDPSLFPLHPSEGECLLACSSFPVSGRQTPFRVAGYNLWHVKADSHSVYLCVPSESTKGLHILPLIE